MTDAGDPITGRSPAHTYTHTHIQTHTMTAPADALLRFIAKDNVQVEHLPWGPHEWISRAGQTDAEKLMLVRVTMPPGQAHKFHRHPALEEIIYVVQGQAEQWVDREHRLLGPGDAAHIPTDVVHGTYNAGSSDLVFLAILSPARFEGPALVDVSQEEPWATLRETTAR